MEIESNLHWQVKHTLLALRRLAVLLGQSQQLFKEYQRCVIEHGMQEERLLL